MPYLNDEAKDQGLDWIIANGTKVDICSAEPAGDAFAGIAAVTLANKSGLTVGVTGDGVIDGRKITVPEITDGSVTDTGTGAFWTLSNGTNILIATGTLFQNQLVTLDNIFSLSAFDITIRDPA